MSKAFTREPEGDEEEDELSYVIKTGGDDELIVATQRGMAILEGPKALPSIQ